MTSQSHERSTGLTGRMLAVLACCALVGVGAVAAVLLSGGEDRAEAVQIASTPPQPETTPPPPPPPPPITNVFGQDMWRPGNQWTYRVTRTAASGVSDESAQLDFKTIRRIESVADKGGQTLVTLVSEGGISKPRRRTFIASDKCYLHSRTGEVVMCLSGTDADLVPRELSGLNYNVQSVQDVQTQVLFDPAVGPVVEKRTDKKGRVIIRELIGYRVGAREAGAIDDVPLTCEWDAKHTKGTAAGVAGGTGTTSQREAAAFGLAGRIRAYEVPLSGCCGSSKFTALRDSTSTLFRFQGLSAGPWLIPTPIIQLKAWSDTRGTGEYVAMLLEGDVEVVIAIMRLKSGDSKLWVWRFDKALDPPRYFAIYLTNAGRGCEFQLRRRIADAVEVALFSPQADGLRRTGGSLVAEEVALPERSLAPAMASALACKPGSRFEPAQVLRQMQRDGFIARSPSGGADGIPYFAVLKPLKYLGMEASHAFGWSHDGVGDLFYRGPGTAPPVHVGLVLQAPLVEVKRKVPPQIVVDEHPYVEGSGVGIWCSLAD